jgi:D-arginine dehydrogenase
MAIVDADFVIIGAGIAGASVGYFLAPKGRTVILERERQPGYHTTGRSVAMFMESYGSAQVRLMTAAGRAFFEAPPAEFAASLLTPRPTMSLACPGQEQMLDEHFSMVQSVTPQARRLDAREACEQIPVLRPERIIGAVLDPTSADVDVNSLHQGFLRGIRRAGGQLRCDREVSAVANEGGQWRVEAAGETYRAPVLVNAAGAWCDHIASLAGVKPIGLVPKRRSAFMFSPPPGLNIENWPMCVALDETWYLKRVAGLLLGSPANADPVVPQDVQPDEFDIALGIHRIEEMTTLQIGRPTRTWAGLRSFVADGGLVGGFAPAARGFFWLAAQGGYGIQTSPAMGEACAALILGEPLPPRLAAFGVTREMLDPARL